MVAVFVSYAREDTKFAEGLYDSLMRPGIDAWLDQDRLKPGRWEPALTEALERSRFVLPLLSRHSLDPEEQGYVQKEWELALGGNKVIIPILVEELPEPIKSTNWFARMSEFQWYDLGADDDDANLRKLLRSLLEADAGDTFRETFSSDGPDQEGWSFDEWSLVAEDATRHKSQSLHAEAAAAFSRRQTLASIQTKFGDWDTLEYTRRLDLNSANIFSSASFRLVANDGAEHVVDEQTKQNFGNYKEESWTLRRIKVGQFSGRMVRLEFVLEAEDRMSSTTYAKAWLDNIRVYAAGASAHES